MYTVDEILNGRFINEDEFTTMELLQIIIAGTDEGDCQELVALAKELLPPLQISFSGGRTSAYLCKLIKDYNIPVKFVYMDTGAEHPKTYDFIRNVNNFLNLDLICLRGRFNTPLGKGNNFEIVTPDSLKWDLSIWGEMMQKYSTPYFKGEFCTDRMKTGIFKKWQKQTFGNYPPVILGIRADEPKRLNTKNPDVIHMAYLFPDVEKQDVLEWWEDQDFNLDIPEYLGNCLFCIKKNPKKVALAIKAEPEMYEEFSKALKCPMIRPAPNGRQQDIMYRGHLSLDGIAYLYGTEDENELKIRAGMEKDTNLCSESCEIQF